MLIEIVNINPHDNVILDTILFPTWVMCKNNMSNQDWNPNVGVEELCDLKQLTWPLWALFLHLQNEDTDKRITK